MKVKFELVKKVNGSKYFNIKLTQHGKRKFIAVKAPFGPEVWDYNKQQLKGVSTRNQEKHQEYIRNRNWVANTVKPYQDAIDELTSGQNPFTFDDIKKQVDNPKKKVHTVFELWESRIEELKNDNRFGTADAYQGTLNKFKEFHPGDLMFIKLDKILLLDFKKSMKGLSNDSVSIHLRNIRALWNKAIKLKIAKRDQYPFEDGEVMQELPGTRSSRAIKRSEVNKIRSHKLELEEGSEDWHSCNYFMFSYLGRGINFQDIARLKWSSIKDGRVEFVRYKTRSKVQDKSSFAITQELAEILSWYRRNNTQLHNPYVFPILNASHDTEVKIYNRIKKVRKQVNASLRGIGEHLGLSVKITTYVARHSFASVAKNELKVSESMISEMLGHQDLETTKAYLAQWPDEDKDKAVIGL